MYSTNIDQRLLKGPAFYKVMQRHITTLQKQELNGYPRPHPYDRSRAVINAINLNKLRPKPVVYLASDERMCERCSTRYRVDSTGMPVKESGDTCFFHWGRTFRDPQTNVTAPYTCCGQSVVAKGCTLAKWHVSNIENLTNLDGYVQTEEKSWWSESNYGVYALDCEMSYTTAGSEVTSIAVVSSDCRIVYETLVKPDNPVLDYNTRFSGLTENDLKYVTTTLKDVQKFLLNLFCNKTILIGHGLGADLRALRMIHDTIVDTAIVFPHPRGLPFKKALKKLVSDILGKDIQKESGGHISKEDAIACMELMIWKVKPLLG